MPGESGSNAVCEMAREIRLAPTPFTLGQWSSARIPELPGGLNRKQGLSVEQPACPSVAPLALFIIMILCCFLLKKNN